MKESSVKTLNKENKYNTETSFKGWIITNIRNIFMSNYKKVVNELIYVERPEVEEYPHLPNKLDIESAERAYDLKTMSHVMRELSKDYKIPFSMHVAGFEYWEIADKLGLPLGIVKSRISFTCRRLHMNCKS